ncbi:MFS transporter [Nocardioides humi]|uniref:Major facilitator superfamily (MFS) profile domain-containing protein n=1 Tax=Nocardioides humi TaxID=449461 RepID=A0ABN1ZYX4_9ACTN|nr:MFS transporter [Nocardioides humi]
MTNLARLERMPSGRTAARRSDRAFLAVVVVAGVGLGLTAPFTAVLVTALHGSPAAAAVVVSSMGLSLLVSDTFCSRLIPRLDSRLAISAAMVVFGLGSAVTAATTTWHVVGLARIGQGFGAALFMSGGMHLALHLARRGDEAAAIGSFNAAWFAGVATGPLGGGLIASLLPGADGLRLLFGVCAAVNLVGAVLAWNLIPRRSSSEHVPLRQAVRTIGLPGDLGIRGARVRGALVLVGLGQGVRSAIAMTLIPLVAEGAGMGWAAIGVALAALALTDVTSMQTSSTWSDRWGRRPVLVAALGFGCVTTGLLGIVPTSLPVVVALAFLAGVTVGTTWVVPAAMIVDLLPDREHAVVAYRIASDVGMLASGLLVGAALLVLPIHATLGVAAGLLLLSILLALVVGETRSSHPTTAGGTHALPID